MTIPKGLAARAVLELTDGRKFYIEVQDGSVFVKFYTIYTARGRGRRRTTERHTFESRNFASGIEEAGRKFEKHFNTFGKAKVTEMTVKIYRKRLYAKRFRMRPDELGLARVRPLFDRHKKITSNLFIRKTEAALA